MIARVSSFSDKGIINRAAKMLKDVCIAAMPTPFAGFANSGRFAALYTAKVSAPKTIALSKLK